MVAQPVSTPDSNISAVAVEQQQQQANDLGAGIENDMASSVASSYHQQFHQHHHHYMSKKERLVATSTSKTNLYIKGLGEDTTDKDLFDLCERFGEIKSTKAIIDKATNKCKGYGFVDFKRQEDAKKALSELKKDQHDVQLAKQREQDPTNLYFANLPHDVDEEMLNNMLKDKFNAAVSSTRIMREKNGNSKGVGFARIDDDQLCDKIISELNNQPFPDHTDQSKQILVKLADSCSIIKSPPPPPSYTLSSSSKIYRQDHYSQPHSINSLDNSSSSFASSATATAAAQPNDTNNNQYGINNLNLGYRQPQHHFYTHHLNPYEVYNNYQYAIMVDQNGGGYMAPTGQSQATASAAAGYGGANSNIPLLQTPQQQQQQATTTSATGAALNSPAASFTAANSRQQAHQSYSNPHALIHQSQYYPGAASSQHPSAPHNQISSHQMPYYFIANPYHQQTYNYNPSTAHIHQLQAYNYQQQQQHSNNPSHQAAAAANAHQTNVSNTNTPSSTPISQSSSSLAQNMSNLSINSLSTAVKPPNN